MLPVLLPGDPEHARLGLFGGSGEEHLRRVDVTVGDRALTVSRLRLNVRVRVAGGRFVGEGGVTEVVLGPKRLRDPSSVVWINGAHQVGCEIFHGDAVLDCIELIPELAARYDLREVMYDPWRFGQAAQELEQERVIVTAFPQTDVRMVPASDRL